MEEARSRYRSLRLTSFGRQYGAVTVEEDDRMILGGDHECVPNGDHRVYPADRWIEAVEPARGGVTHRRCFLLVFPRLEAAPHRVWRRLAPRAPGTPPVAPHW